MSETVAAQMPVVETKGGVVAYLSLEGAAKAAAFYEKAFGAAIVSQYPPDESGRTMHVHLHINDSSVMLSDFYPEHGYPPVKPQAFSLTLLVRDIETWWTRAIDAGCTPVTPPEKMFWGDTYGQLSDPFGVMWAMNQPAKAGAD